jgi:hypothetical protein
MFDTIYTSYRNSAQDEFAEFEKDLSALSGGTNSAVDWPADVPAPLAEVKCGCTDHYERTELTLLLNVAPKKLYDIVFGNDSFLVNLHKKRGDWVTSVLVYIDHKRVEYIRRALER